MLFDWPSKIVKKLRLGRFLKRQNSYILAILVLTLLVAGIVRYVQVTLADIEESIPLKVIEDSHAMSAILFDINEITQGLAVAKLAIGTERERKLASVRDRLVNVNATLEKKRVEYGFDNLIGTAAIYGILSPALFDIRGWIEEGISGLPPENDIVLNAMLDRARGALAKADSLHDNANGVAIDLLRVQAEKISTFRQAVLLVLLGLAGLAAILIYYIYNRRASELALQQSEWKYRRIYENAREGIFQAHGDGTLIDVNPAMAFFLGYNSAEEMKRLVSLLQSSVYTDMEIARKHFMLLTKRQYLIDEIYQWRRKDGTLTWGGDQCPWRV